MPLTSVTCAPVEQVATGEATVGVAEVLVELPDVDSGAYITGDEASLLASVRIEVDIAELLTPETGPPTLAATFV